MVPAGGRYLPNGIPPQTPIPRNHPHTYIHTSIHPSMHAYIHTYMPIPTNLRRYIHTTPNPPHRGARGSMYVPCMIVGFQGGSTPNPRNHPHRGGEGGACRPVPYIIYIYIIYYILYIYILYIIYII